jgi:ferrochelatase
MKAVLLLAHGTPESLDDMPEYLTRVRGGRPPSPELIEEMRGNYGAIGGRSPLTEITRAGERAASVRWADAGVRRHAQLAALHRGRAGGGGAGLGVPS